MFEKIREILNFDNEIPAYVWEEAIRKNNNKSVHVEDELELVASVQDFNAEVDRKLNPNSKQKTVVVKEEEEFFNEIVGYGDIKKIMLKCIKSSKKKPIHVILDGPPASAKSMFLLAMEKKLDKSYYVDGVNATGPGMVKYLFENDVEYLFIDEVEKMSNANQNVLLNVMETGILTSTKVKQTANKQMNLSIYATTNEIDYISKPFRSRMLEFSLPEYTEEDFKEIAIKLLNERYGHGKELALKIADTIWNKMGSKDVRDLLQVGQLSETIEEVDEIAETLQKYKRKSEDEDE